MALNVQAVRGMNDLLPEDTSVWQQVERVLRETLSSFGYSEVRMPVVEHTGLFCRVRQGRRFEGCWPSALIAVNN